MLRAVCGEVGQIFPGKEIVLQKQVAVGASVFGDGGGAGIDVGEGFVAVEGRDVRVAAEERVARHERRRVGFAVHVAVGGVEDAVGQGQDAVIGHHREGEHHLIHLCLAVAAHADEMFADAIEQLDHTLGGVFVRQIVAWAVVEQVAQQEDTRLPFPPPCFEQALTPAGGAVDIGCDHELHGIPSVV